MKEDIANELEYVKGWYTKNYENLCAQFGIDNTMGISNAISYRIESGVIYTIDGRKINDNIIRKGVYIVNGRKFVVK